MPKASPAAAPALPTRERIRAIAEDLYVLRGHDGFSFGDIAASIGTTRANIHHHFGGKRQLMAELIEKFVADAGARIAQNWTREGLSFGALLVQTYADVTGCEIVLPRAEDGVLLGTSLAAAAAAGLYPDLLACGHAMVHDSRVVVPDPDTARIHARGYRAFRLMLEQRDTVQRVIRAV